MRRILFSVICVATLASACSATGNDEHAYVLKQGPPHLIEIKGRRRLLAHDPISAILGRTYEETFTMELPRIEGVIDGAEISVGPDRIRYIGRVVITSGKMKVDLYYGNRSDDPEAALSWNGEYKLVQRDRTGMP